MEESITRLIDITDELLARCATDLPDAVIAEEAVLVDQLESKTAALKASRIAAANSRKLSFDANHRSEATWLATETRRKRGAHAAEIKTARRVIDWLPDMYTAVVDGTITWDHATAVAKICGRRELRDQAVADQQLFLRWASSEPWASFEGFLAAWIEINDPRDPQDLDDKAFDDRSLITAQGLDHVTMVQIDTPNLCWEQARTVLEPHYRRLLEADWVEARERVGDDATWGDLTRTDPQRWHDAWIAALRSVAGDDAAAAVEACVVVDLDTLLDEADRQAEHRPELDLDDRSASDVVGDLESSANVVGDLDDLDARIRRYRCQTRTGLSITPSTALLSALAGDIRRVAMSAKSLDFEASESTRLYRGIKRHALLLRDRHCTGAGCDTAAWRCQADHHHPHSQGGPTTPRNGRALCPACHRHKTRLETLGLSPPDG